eukprot:9091493-Prorocentrum_lima.AAC.1
MVEDSSLDLVCAAILVQQRLYSCTLEAQRQVLLVQGGVALLPGQLAHAMPKANGYELAVDRLGWTADD